MELQLIDGMKIPVTLDSHWLFIEEAQGKVSFEIESTGEVFTLTQKSLYKYTVGRFGRIFVSGIGRLVFEHGVGDYIPSVEGQSLNVANMPELTIADGQRINAIVETMPEVDVTTMPPMTLAEKQYVRIESLPVIKVAANQSISTKLSSEHTSEEVSAFPHVIDANTARRKLVIKAATSNTAPVLIGAYPLNAGERETIDSTAELTLSGDAGDLVYLMEW